MTRLPTLKSVPDDQRGPMSKAQTESFIMLNLAPPAEPVPGPELLDALRKEFGDKMATLFEMQVLVGRLALTDQSYDPRTVVMCLMLTDRVGVAVQWAYYLYEETRLRGRPLRAADLAEDFPMGFPTSEGYSTAWDGQKGYLQDPKIPNVDNLLDVSETWKAPAEEPVQ